MKHYLFLILLVNLNVMAQNFSVISNSDFKKYVKEVGYTKVAQNPDNKAIVYYLNNGEIAVYPVMSTRGLIFKSVEIYELNIKNGIIPLEEKGNLLADNQDKVNRLLNKDNSLIDEMGELLPTYNFGEYNFNKLDQLIRKFGKERFYNTCFINFCYYIGNYFVFHKGWCWVSFNDYLINKYTVFDLNNGIRNINFIATIVKYFNPNNKIPLKEYIDSIQSDSQVFWVNDIE